MPLFGPPDIVKLRKKKDVKGLIKALQYKDDLKIRQAAAETLGQNMDVRAVPPLIKALRVDKSGV